MADWNERVELKPCPFCKGEVEDWIDSRWCIVCVRCGYQLHR